MKRSFSPLLALGLAALLCSCSVFYSKSAGYYPPKGNCTRIVTYNVGTFTKSGTNRLKMVADMMKELDADIICLNELDSCTSRTHKSYQLKTFAREMGRWNYAFTRAIPFQGGSYGIGIACKPSLRIRDSWSLSLERGRGGEQRALSVVEFDRMVVAATHLDHKSESARIDQARTISAALKARYASSGKTVVLSGDFNDTPSSRVLEELRRDWTVISETRPTYDSSKPRHCIDYILVLNGSGSPRIKRSAVCTHFEQGDVTLASDHLPVYADLKP